MKSLRWFDIYILLSRDEFELEFSGSSEPELSMKVPSWAEPSWGTSIFELKPSWIFFKNSNQISKFSTSIMIIINCMIICMKIYNIKGALGSWKLWFRYFIEKKNQNQNFGSFSANFWFRAEGKKVTSRAEPSWKSFSSSSGSSQLSSDSSLVGMYEQAPY